MRGWRFEIIAQRSLSQQTPSTWRTSPLDYCFQARKRVWRAFREDYFAVPDILARKKEFAEFFAKRWGRLIGPVQLVYARTPKGRRMLLERAWIHSLARFQ